MHLEIDHAHHYDWALRHASEVGEEDVARPSPHGPQFRMVRELRTKPATTTIVIPDGEVERMVADHKQGVATARRGYTAIQEGGPQHGEEVFVPARELPQRSPKWLIADHLESFIYDHTPGDRITAVRVISSALTPEEQAELERYLTRRLSEEDA